MLSRLAHFFRISTGAMPKIRTGFVGGIERVTIAGLGVDKRLYDFVNDKVLPGTSINAGDFWPGFADIVDDLAPKNRALLANREALQNQLDDWYEKNPGPIANMGVYKKFLKKIGYLAQEGKPFSITTGNVDPELSTLAGPQLVVPVMNARYALNAANARWGSLYDALYGTDAIAETKSTKRGKNYNPARGAKVVAWGRQFLDMAIPLKGGKHTQVTRYFIDKNKFVAEIGKKNTVLANPKQFVGFTGEKEKPASLLFVNNDLHIEVMIDPDDSIGKTDKAFVSDIILESATTVIMDCEDSVAAVDGEDKVAVYANWLGLMQGNLTDEFVKGGEKVRRTLHKDRNFTTPSGRPSTLPGRAVMLVRNVGHLMTNPAILDSDGNQVPEGIMDGVITSLIALHDVGPTGRNMNSRKGSVYIVKPKMHGPEEVAFACELFDRVEALLKMKKNTLKMGIMDEERRTTINLKECIRAAKSRVVFINTGFLDRTGDEIHTSMRAGPMIRKGDMKSAAWIAAYENWNVDIGLACGLAGKAQIGKGMWAMPDLMAEMLKTKIGHPKAGANTAWVPSPTAAILHATHYHQIKVSEVQKKLARRKKASLDDILSVPVAKRPNWSKDHIKRELDNNAQGILGYVVRWVDHGVGCSKVPDINNIGLMEDRATLRISSQHMANWLEHGVCSKAEIMASLKRMAKVVDRQNRDDLAYQPMAENFDNSIAFAAACDLVFEGVKQPSGYTEPILHQKRLELKAKTNKR